MFLSLSAALVKLNLNDLQSWKLWSIRTPAGSRQKYQTHSNTCVLVSWSPWCSNAFGILEAFRLSVRVLPLNSVSFRNIPSSSMSDLFIYASLCIFMHLYACLCHFNPFHNCSIRMSCVLISPRMSCLMAPLLVSSPPSDTATGMRSTQINTDQHNKISSDRKWQEDTRWVKMENLNVKICQDMSSVLRKCSLQRTGTVSLQTMNQKETHTTHTKGSPREKWELYWKYTMKHSRYKYAEAQKHVGR